MHRFEIKPRIPGDLMTGHNTQVLMDGKVLRGVRALRFEISAGETASLWLDIIPGSVSLDGSLDTGHVEKPSSFITAIEGIK